MSWGQACKWMGLTELQCVKVKRWWAPEDPGGSSWTEESLTIKPGQAEKAQLTKGRRFCPRSTLKSNRHWRGPRKKESTLSEVGLLSATCVGCRSNSVMPARKSLTRPADGLCVRVSPA